MTARLLEYFSGRILNSDRKYLRNNGYTSIGYFYESHQDTCGHDIPMSLFNTKVDNRGNITFDISLESLLATGSIPDLLVKYFYSPYYICSYKLGSLVVLGIDRELSPIEKEVGFSVKSVFGDFPLEFGVYEIFILKEYRDLLVNKIKEKLHEFDVERNISKSFLEGVILQNITSSLNLFASI